ncbi:hypothetical protein QE152_g4786 [Popillia japonica]|uniref:Uncharacterized protein n=1 Tax=Popillia japonica TaxID=7064 RepID=A0AAW1MZ01_POPJA
MKHSTDIKSFHLSSPLESIYKAKIYLILERILPENLKTLQRVAFVDPMAKFPATIPPGYQDAGFQEGQNSRRQSLLDTRTQDSRRG